LVESFQEWLSRLIPALAFFHHSRSDDSTGNGHDGSHYSLSLIGFIHALLEREKTWSAFIWLVCQVPKLFARSKFAHDFADCVYYYFFQKNFFQRHFRQALL